MGHSKSEKVETEINSMMAHDDEKKQNETDNHDNDGDESNNNHQTFLDKLEMSFRESEKKHQQLHHPKEIRLNNNPKKPKTHPEINQEVQQGIQNPSTNTNPKFLRAQYYLHISIPKTPRIKLKKSPLS